jgi:peroxiredoxin Q/BCP
MQIGEPIPDLEFALGSGTSASFRDYRGKWLVLYFYPKDNTPGCTTEGVDFRDRHAAFTRAGAVILGCSRDSQKSHQNFCGKFAFPFDLISDTDERVCKAFAVIKEKNMYGRKVLGIERSTFLFDPEGHLRAAWRGLKVPGHVDAVLAELKRAKSSA